MTKVDDAREWARGAGLDVTSSGRLPNDVWDRFLLEHDLDPALKQGRTTGVAGCDCGRRWTGTTSCHCRLCHRHFSAVKPFDLHRPSYDGCLDPATATHPKTGELLFRSDVSDYGTTWLENREYKGVGSDGEAVQQSLL